jgi:hypothetical protein
MNVVVRDEDWRLVRVVEWWRKVVMVVEGGGES